MNLCTNYITNNDVFSYVQWNKYFHSVKYEMSHSTRRRMHKYFIFHLMKIFVPLHVWENIIIHVISDIILNWVRKHLLAFIIYSIWGAELMSWPMSYWKLPKHSYGIDMATSHIGQKKMFHSKIYTKMHLFCFNGAYSLLWIFDTHKSIYFLKSYNSKIPLVP